MKRQFERISADWKTRSGHTNKVIDTKAPWQGNRLPILCFKGPKFEAFIDKKHPIFVSFRTKPESFIALELAQYLYEQNRVLLTNKYFVGLHSVACPIDDEYERRRVILG